MSKVYQAAVLEFVGMAFFVYASGMLSFFDLTVPSTVRCGNFNSPFKNAVTLAGIVGLFVYAGTGIAKVTLNPCATLVLILTKHISIGQGLLNILANFGGSAFAGLVLYLVLENIYGINSKEEFLLFFNQVWDWKTKAGFFFTNESWICTESIAAFLTLVITLYGIYNFQAEPATKSVLAATAVFLPMVSIYPLTGAGLHPAHYFGLALVNGVFLNLSMRVYWLASGIGILFALPLTWYLFLGREFKGMLGIATSDAQVVSPEQESTHE